MRGHVLDESGPVSLRGVMRRRCQESECLPLRASTSPAEQQAVLELIVCKPGGVANTALQPVGPVVISRAAVNCANHSLALDTIFVQILLRPAKLPDSRPPLRLTIARLPCCIVILLRHSLAQKNLLTSDDSIIRGGELPTELLCGLAMLVLGRKLFLGENFRVADRPRVNESSRPSPSTFTNRR